MKKLTKLIALMIVIVMVITTLTACSLIGVNTSRYRSVVAVTVGDEKVTVGKILDSYTSNYYQYYSQLSSGQMTVDDLFSTTMDDIYTTYSMIDSYKNAEGTKTYPLSENSYIEISDDMKYLTEAESEYVLAYSKYSMFTTLDSQVENYIKADKSELATLEEETDRAFDKYDDLGTAATYADKLYNDSMDREEIDTYFNDYYGANFNMYTVSIDGYVFANDAAAKAKVDNINERLAKYAEDNDIEEAKTITAAEYIAYQNDAVKSITNSIKLNNDTTVADYHQSQVESLVASVIANKYSLSIAYEIESDEDALIEALKDNYNRSSKAFDTTFNQNKDLYFSFMNALSDTMYIFDIPAAYQNDFIFVKNLLVQFNDEQKAQLSNMETITGGKTSEQYIAYREQLAAEIVGTDFNNDEAEVEGLFTLDGGKIALNPTGALGAAMTGSVTNDKFMDLMVQYNTDTAQHTSYYDYVVYVGTDKDFTHNWVPEFVDAAEEAYADGLGGWALAVSDFGVHIVYYSADVTAWTSFNGDNIYDTTTNEYRYLVDYYNKTLSKLSATKSEELTDNYRYGSKIVANSGLKYMLKELGIEYDFDKAMTKDTEETK